MKKIIALVLVSTGLVSCSVQTPHIVEPDKCPWQMGQLSKKTIQDFELGPDRLIGSKVSITGEIKLGIATAHQIDAAGRHNFFENGWLIPDGSVGIITDMTYVQESDTEIVSPKIIEVSFRDTDSIQINLSFEIDGTQTKEPNLIKRSDLSEADYRNLLTKGIKADDKGFLKNSKNEFYELKNGKAVVYQPGQTIGSGRYKLKLFRVEDVNEFSSNIPLLNVGGYLKSGKNFLVFDSVKSEMFIVENTNVFLDHFKFRVCSNVKTLQSEGFDKQK